MPVYKPAWSIQTKPDSVAVHETRGEACDAGCQNPKGSGFPVSLLPASGSAAGLTFVTSAMGYGVLDSPAARICLAATDLFPYFGAFFSSGMFLTRYSTTPPPQQQTIATRSIGMATIGRYAIHPIATMMSAQQVAIGQVTQQMSFSPMSPKQVRNSAENVASGMKKQMKPAQMMRNPMIRTITVMVSFSSWACKDGKWQSSVVGVNHDVTQSGGGGVVDRGGWRPRTPTTPQREHQCWARSS